MLTASMHRSPQGARTLSLRASGPWPWFPSMFASPDPRRQVGWCARRTVPTAGFRRDMPPYGSPWRAPVRLDWVLRPASRGRIQCGGLSITPVVPRQGSEVTNHQLSGIRRQAVCIQETVQREACLGVGYIDSVLCCKWARPAAWKEYIDNTGRNAPAVSVVHQVKARCVNAGVSKSRAP